MEFPRYDCRFGDLTSRRGFFQSTAAGFFGFALANRGQSLMAANAKQRTAKKMLVIWADGGPSQFETFDPKPGRETGGTLGAIDTNVSGLRISETLPRVAQQMDKMSVIRNLTSREGEHARAKYYLHTGYNFVEAFPRPALGSIFSRESESGALPNYVTIGSAGYGPAYLGLENGPFSIEDAERARELLRTLESRRDRIQLTRKLSEQFGAGRPSGDAQSRLAVLSRIERLIDTPFERSLDLSREPEKIRQRFGEGTFAKNALLARRLLETGVPFVEIHHGGWDTHAQNDRNVGNLCREIDQAWSALMEDLSAGGLLDETIVVWLGEFGRTPGINANSGRDHFPQVTPVVIGGGGIAGGQVIGETDREGISIKGDSCQVADLFATILGAMGVKPDEEYETDFGSMTEATDGGKAIRGLL